MNFSLCANMSSFSSESHMIVITSKCVCIFYIAAGLVCINSTYVDGCILPQQSPKFHDYFIREYLASEYI